MDSIVICLLLYSLLREGLFFYERQRLINKIMSRNYHEYTVAQSAGKLDQNKAVDQERMESIDIGQLVGIG